jgi:hypothetical protein
MISGLFAGVSEVGCCHSHSHSATLSIEVMLCLAALSTMHLLVMLDLCRYRHNVYDQDDVLKDLPRPLLRDIALYKLRAVIEAVPLLNDTGQVSVVLSTS